MNLPRDGLHGPHLDERAAQAMLLIANGLPRLETTKGWRLIPSMSCEGAFYLIDPHGECSCNDRHYRQRVCKHELACRIQDVLDAATGEPTEPTLPF
jgi:hypothetical protein